VAHIYLYDNTGGRGQICCKVCDSHFNKNKSDFKLSTLTCPYCGNALSKKKDRKHFNIHLGLSTRVTARALLEIHGVKISNAMVSKYAKTAATGIPNI